MRELLVKIAREVSSFLYEQKDSSDIGKIVGYHDNDVTRLIDKKSEELIVDRLSHSGYKFKFVTEESGVIENGNFEYVALIDPLDGSTNFLSGIPWSSVSIAVYKKGENNMLSSLYGVVSNIFTRNVYSYDEKYAYVNDVVVNEKPTPPDRILLLSYFSRSKLPYVKAFLDNINASYKIRSLGSASLDMILVCTGKATMYFDIRGKLRNVDVASSSNFCKRLGLAPVDVKLNELNVGIEKVETIKEIILSLDKNLLQIFSLSLQKV